ncbi:MAG: tetratricopeptide repeat protein [Leptospiraceae bacterium]|nr:tetratricopeptide repeat protein [Leptospiraceae bacterium]MCP5502785.1 tetratricopeptide repeat protein [Leptospiraceae bacterium]
MCILIIHSSMENTVYRLFITIIFAGIFMYSSEPVFSEEVKTKTCTYKTSSDKTIEVEPTFLYSLALYSRGDDLDTGSSQQIIQARYKESISYFKAYIACVGKPGPYVLMEYSRSLFVEGSKESLALAAENLETVLQTLPSYREAYILKSRLFIRENRIIEAKEFLEKSIILFPGDTEIIFLLANISRELDNIPKARLYFNSLLYSIQNRDGNMRYMPYVLKSLGDIYTASGDIHKALESYKHFLQYKPDDWRTTLLIARHLSLLEEYKEAKKYLRRVLELEPGQSNAMEILAEIALTEGKAEFIHILKGLQEKKILEKNYLLLLLYKIFIEKQAKSEKEFFEIADRIKDHLLIHLVLNELYLEKGENKKLYENIKQAAYLCRSMRRPALAIRLMRKLLKNPQTKTFAGEEMYLLYSFIGSCYMELKDYPRSIRYLKKSIEVNKNQDIDYKLNIQLVYTLRLNGKESVLESIKLAEALLRKRESKDPDIYFIQGLNYLAVKEYNESLVYFNKAIELSPSNPSYYFYRANTKDELGKKEEAELDLKKSLEVDSSYAASLNYLGYIYVEKKMHLEEASKLLHSATDLEPNNSAYRDSLAWLLFRMGKVKEASYHIQLAVILMKEEGGEDPVLYEHLGDIQEAMKEHSNAKESWERAFQLQKSKTEKKKLQKKIENISIKE